MAGHLRKIDAANYHHTPDPRLKPYAFTGNSQAQFHVATLKEERCARQQCLLVMKQI
jgi:hypothetical protein